MTKEILTEAAGFIWLTARALEQRRFEYLFGDGTAEAVLAAVDSHRTADGAYAYGIEPDIKGPTSQPAALRMAVPVLAEAGGLAERAGRLCDWLATVTAPGGGVPAVLPSLLDYPHPPWLIVPGEPVGALLPTGDIAGPMLGAGVRHPWLDAAVEFCWAAVEGLDETHPYEVHSAIAFLDRAPDRARAEEAAERVGNLVRERGFVYDPAYPERFRVAPGYAEEEWHFAHDYAHGPESLAARWFTDEEMGRSLDALEESQGDDGGFPIRWAKWGPTTESDARPAMTLEALVTLRAWGRL